VPVPIICADPSLWQFASVFRGSFSKPQFKYFVTVLLALLLCQGPKTLSGLLDCVVSPATLSGLSRFFGLAPWDAAALFNLLWLRFVQRVSPRIEAERERQLRTQRNQRARDGRARDGRSKESKKRGGRYRQPKPTVYLIGDDSVMSKRKARKMEGVGGHYSTTAKGCVRGHCMVMGLCLALGCLCPLMPLMYRQKKTAQAEGKPFRDKIDLMGELICRFSPLPGTQTMVLLDSWYACSRIWKAATSRGFGICCGIKSNRYLQIQDGGPIHGRSATGREWVKLTEHTAKLRQDQYQRILWPSPSNLKEKDPQKQRWVYVHTISTRIRGLGRCQVVIVREKFPTAEKKEGTGKKEAGDIYYFACSDLQANIYTLAQHMATRWQIEVLFGDTKELLGLDQYQMIGAEGVQRFWSVVMIAYAFLDEVRDALVTKLEHPVTIGEARQHIQQLHYRHLLNWILKQFQQDTAPEELYRQLLSEPLSERLAA
jgi:SRSO17 transposase